MSQVHYVKSAAKDYPHAGIKKGEPYYWWKPFRMGRRMSKVRPKPSQVATSDYAIGVLSAIEALEEWQGEWTESDRDDLVSQMEELRDAEQDKFGDLPEGFQQGDLGMTIEQRISDLDEWIDELNSIEFPEGEDSLEDTPLMQALAAAPSV